MKRDTGSFVVRAAALLICLTSLLRLRPLRSAKCPSPGSGSLSNELSPMPKPGPTSATRDGHPDLSGVWFIGTSGTVDLTAAGSPSQRRLILRRRRKRLPRPALGGAQAEKNWTAGTGGALFDV